MLTRQMKPLSQKIAVLKKEIAELSEKHETLVDEFDIQTLNFNTVRYGLIMLHNRGLFGRFNDMDKNAIAKLTALKTENPSLTVDEARVMLQDANMEMTKKEVRLIFAIYFNDFD